MGTSHKKKSHKDEDDDEDETEIEETEESEPEEESEPTEPSIYVDPSRFTPLSAGVENPDPQYEMVMELDTDSNTVTGSMILTFTNTSNTDMYEIYLRDYPAAFQDKNGSYEMDITNVQDLRTYTDLECARDGNDMTTVIVLLDEPVKAGEDVSIYLDFETPLPTRSDRFGYYDGIYSLTDFYPILCRFDINGEWSHEPYYFEGECFTTDVSDYVVELTVPEGYKVATGGQIISEETDGGYTSLQITAEDIRDFTAIASDEFEMIESEQNGITYYVYYVPTKYIGDDEAESAMDTCINSIGYFSECFGDYPYETFSCVFSPMPMYAGGMEYSGLVLIDNEMEGYAPDEFYGYSIEATVAHECAHQWFMGIVGSDSYNEAWLDEGFASYLEWVYCKEFYPDQAIDGPWWLGYDISTTIDEYDSLAPGAAYINRSIADMDDYTYAITAYVEGSHFLYLLEKALGEEQMYAFVKEYVSRYYLQNATTADFADTLYDVVGTDNDTVNKIVDTFLDI